MNYRICIIVPYFGKLPNTFQYWLNSCASNSEYDWIVFTDDRRKYNWPKNVIHNYVTFDDFVNRIEAKLGFKTALNTPYKLCDFRPLYGWLFQDILIGYTHWGYCDLDMLFGILSHFITKDYLSYYDKINCLGHLSIYKNNDEVNHAFTKCNYRKILNTKRNQIFDEIRNELNINNLLINNGFKVLKTIEYADICTQDFSFRLAKYYDGHKTTKLKKKPLIFENGSDGLYGITVSDNQISKIEYAYVHFQKRNIKPPCQIYNKYLLIPNTIVEYKSITPELVLENSRDSLPYRFEHTIKRIELSVRRRLL